MPVLIYSLSALVGLILAVTGVIKLREGRRPLGQAIEMFRVVPAAVVRPIAAVLPLSPEGKVVRAATTTFAVSEDMETMSLYSMGPRCPLRSC